MNHEYATPRIRQAAVIRVIQEPAEVPFPGPAVPIRIGTGPDDGFFHSPQQLAATADIAFGLAEDPFFLAATGRTDTNSHESDFLVETDPESSFVRLQPRSQGIGNLNSFGTDNDAITAQAAPPPGVLVAQLMTTKRFAMLDLAGSGQFEPLFHSFVGFLLGHRKGSVHSSVVEFALGERKPEWSSIGGPAIRFQPTGP